jgi:hypothetical protein
VPGRLDAIFVIENRDAEFTDRERGLQVAMDDLDDASGVDALGGQLVDHLFELPMPFARPLFALEDPKDDSREDRGKGRERDGEERGEVGGHKKTGRRGAPSVNRV